MTRQESTILFVDDNNLEQSVAAEVSLRHKIRNYGLGDRFSVESAGLIATDNTTSTYLHRSLRQLFQDSVNPSEYLKHTPQILTSEQLYGNAIIIGFTAQHQAALKNDHLKLKTYLLSEFVNDGVKEISAATDRITSFKNYRLLKQFPGLLYKTYQKNDMVDYRDSYAVQSLYNLMVETVNQYCLQLAGKLKDISEKTVKA
ncbi:MAG: hypothetical protein ACLFTH_00920 [Candidatus Woesearchaeota archaeon]